MSSGAHLVTLFQPAAHVVAVLRRAGGEKAHAAMHESSLRRARMTCSGSPPTAGRATGPRARGCLRVRTSPLRRSSPRRPRARACRRSTRADGRAGTTAAPRAAVAASRAPPPCSSSGRPRHARRSFAARWRGRRRCARSGPTWSYSGHERHRPVTAHAAKRRLEPHHAAERGRNANGAAGVGAERRERAAGGDGRRRAAARAAGDVRQIPRVVRRTVVWVVVRRAVRELAHVGLADDNRTRTTQPAHDRGVVDRDERRRGSSTRRSCAAPPSRCCP